MQAQSIAVAVPVRLDFAGGWTDVPDFADEEGGAVLNAAIEPAVRGEARWGEEGLRVSYALDLPPDAHLGTSSASNLAWVELIHGLTGKQANATERAEQAFALEQLLGEKSGRQDHYAAALGGFNRLAFGKDRVEVRPLDLTPEHVEDLRDRCLLWHSGASSGSGGLHEALWQRYHAGEAEVRITLRALRDTVEPACSALLSRDWDAFGACLSRNRELARALHAGAVTERTDAFFRAGREAGSIGAKPCGAGGGGALLFLCPVKRREAVRQALARLGGSEIAFRFAGRRGTRSD